MTQRVIVFGAGVMGEHLVRQMVLDSSKEHIPLGFLDDSPALQGRTIHGFPVLGVLGDLETVAASLHPDSIVVAIASVRSQDLLALEARCVALRVTLWVLPTLSEILSSSPLHARANRVSHEDLIGRRAISTDEVSISNLFAEKTVLITGAGGSIGSELAKQISRYSPSRLVLLDRDESALQSTQVALEGHGLLDTDDIVLADIRDAPWIHEVFDSIRPQLVFHAAALKHLPMLERYPQEAWKTNVIGTRNVLEAADSAGVEVFINISTDKAADPISVLGQTKLVTEFLTWKSNLSNLNVGHRRFMSVRFGNVLGSRGSVLGIFQHQAAYGDTVTVTDPRVTRFFMTIQESVHLVLQAAVIGKGGETMVLDMGEPVRILEVAQQAIARANRDVTIEFTGLRKGEKLHEALVGEKEATRPGPHAGIVHIIRSAHDSFLPYFCLIGQSNRRALSRFPLSGQLLRGAKRSVPAPAPPRPSVMR